MNFGSPCLLDDDKPAPVPQSHVLSQVPLGDSNQLLLVRSLLVSLASNPLSDLALELAQVIEDKVITSLLEAGQGSGSEEDQGVAESVSVAGELDLVHQGVDGDLVILGGLEFLGSEARVAQLEVRVEHPVGESSHTDPDAL